MKNIVINFLTAFCCYAFFAGCEIKPADTFSNISDNALDSLLTPISEIETAFSSQRNDFTVTVKGTITRILSDDTAGDKHQRFIIKMSNDQTLLITHNIDIAPRVAGISIGSLIYAHGDYVWNSEGGLVHWTHHDQNGVHENGWIVFDGDKFQ